MMPYCGYHRQWFGVYFIYQSEEDEVEDKEKIQLLRTALMPFCDYSRGPIGIPNSMDAMFFAAKVMVMTGKDEGDK